MAQHGKRILLTLSFILLSLAGYSQALIFGTFGELRNYGAPTARDGHKPAASVISRNRQITYFWNDTCTKQNDSMRHIRPVGVTMGCWEQVTGNTAIAVNGLMRSGDTFYVDTTIARKASLDSFKTAVGNWALTMQSSSQAQSANANLQFQIDNKANRTELGKYADTSMLKSAFNFIEGQVDNKTDYDYVNAADQALRVQDSTEIAGKADKSKVDSIVMLVGGFPAQFSMFIKVPEFESYKITQEDIIRVIQQQLDNKQPKGDYIQTEVDPIYTSERGLYLKKTDTTGKFQPKGNYQLAGDYAFNASLITKVNYFDTGLMLQPYARTSTLAQYQPIGNYATTVDLATKLDIQAADGKYLPITTVIPTVTDRVRYSDTSNMLSPYFRKIDTSNKWMPKNTAIPSIAGLLKASDTTNKWLPINTPIPSITGLVRYSDTSIMLAPYLRKTDTLNKWLPIGTNIPSIAGLVRYTDTATMLSPYLRKADAGLSAISLPNVNVSENALVALAAGWRDVTVTCAGILQGDRVQINPTATLTGYAIGQAIANANNTLKVQVWAPLLAIGANYSIPCKITVFR